MTTGLAGGRPGAPRSGQLQFGIALNHCVCSIFFSCLLTWPMSNTVAITGKLFRMRPKLMLGSRAFWLRQMRQWHWISAAICLIGMMLFAVTGITLNHAGTIEARPAVSERVATMPAPLIELLKGLSAQGKASVPEPVANWVSAALRIDIRDREAELSPGEIYIARRVPAATRGSVSSAGAERRAMNSPTVAGFPISTICTRAAIPARPGRCFSTHLRSPASCSA